MLRQLGEGSLDLLGQLQEGFLVLPGQLQGDVELEELGQLQHVHRLLPGVGDTLACVDVVHEEGEGGLGQGGVQEDCDLLEAQGEVLLQELPQEGGVLAEEGLVVGQAGVPQQEVEVPGAGVEDEALGEQADQLGARHREHPGHSSLLSSWGFKYFYKIY